MAKSPSLFSALLRGAVGVTAASLDVAVVRLVRTIAARKGGQPVDPRRARERLEQAVADSAALDLSSLFAAPPEVKPREEPVRPPESRLGRRAGEEPAVTDLSWQSAFEPQGSARDRFASVVENRTARARLMVHAQPAPAVILVHGFGGGSFSFEERALSARLFFDQGLDVALFQLPFHAQRRPADKSVGLFPSRDTSRTVLAFAQAVSDLRGLAGLLRARGAPAVGLSGMSLGGYTTALAATVERFDFLVPVIPLADLTAVHFEHEAMRAVQVPAELLELGRKALSVVSPLSRMPLVTPERVLVIAGRHDRVTPPATHAARLAAHFSARLDWFEGGHLLQLGRGEAFADAARFMVRR